MPKFKFGVSGMLFAVFRDTDDAYAYQEYNGGYIACFDGYENSVSCFETIGL